MEEGDTLGGGHRGESPMPRGPFCGAGHALGLETGTLCLALGAALGRHRAEMESVCSLGSMSVRPSNDLMASGLWPRRMPGKTSASGSAPGILRVSGSQVTRCLLPGPAPGHLPGAPLLPEIGDAL